MQQVTFDILKDTICYELKTRVKLEEQPWIGLIIRVFNKFLSTMYSTYIH